MSDPRWPATFETGAIHPSVRIDLTARVHCGHLELGAGTVIGRNCLVEGTRVCIGRSGWLDEGARIGGGSCWDPGAFLQAGDWLHVGKGAELNSGRGVTLGDEVGVGPGGAVFSHGAWLDELAGFPCTFAPVTIGSRVWLPHAIVLPGVTIGDDVVVGVGAVVNKRLPSGCLAAGNPCRVVAERVYPRVLPEVDQIEILMRICDEANAIIGRKAAQERGSGIVTADHAPSVTTLFDTRARTIKGPVTESSEVLKNQLRRHGVRFKVSPIEGWYQPWT